IELLEVTVSEIKLFPGSSLNDHTGSYITVLTEKGDSVATAAEEVRDELDMNELTDRRDNISLQGMVTIITAAKKAGEEGDVTMRAVLSQLIDTAISVFNLTFLMVTEAAAAP
ncbi:hypothetical protein BDFG_09274, partial [Blastomyces dermatitidis ATCC 26199]